MHKAAQNIFFVGLHFDLKKSGASGINSQGAKEREGEQSRVG
jgi:hypothetical protein